MADKKKLDLRKPVTGTAASRPSRPRPAPLQDMLGPGTFQPGQVLDPRYMTPWERKQLASIGWE